MRPVPDQLVFDRAELKARGWSDSAIGRALLAGRLLRVRRGIFTAAPATTPVVAAAAAARDIASCAVGHRSGLLMLGLPLIGPNPDRPDITVHPHGPGSVWGAHLHRATYTPDDVVLVKGVPVLKPARTLIDVGRSLSTLPAVAAMDAALNRGIVTREELSEVVRGCAGWSRIRRAVRALNLADGRAESALETYGRLVFPRLRIPKPQLQTKIFDERGREIARLDFYWDELGVAGEADGRGKYDGRTYSDRPGLDVFDQEKTRQDRAEALHLAVMRFGWVHAARARDELRRRFESAADQAARYAAAGVPRLWTHEFTPFR